MSPTTLVQWRRLVLLAVVAATFGARPIAAWAQAEQTHSAEESPKAEEIRRAKVKVTPAYPELARSMHVSGAVKLQVVVTASGAVKSAKPLGGHPLLVQSALDAVKHWKFNPAPQESTTVVEFKFNGS